MSSTKEALRLSADSSAEVGKTRAPARNSGRAKLRNGRKPLSRSASPLKPATSREQKQPGARARQLHAAMMAFRDGDFAVRLPTDWEGIEGRIAEAFNQALAHEDRITREITRLSNARC